MSHYKPYPKYKDSGVEWLGVIPSHWKRGPLKVLISIENGADYKAVEADSGIPVMGSGGAFAYASKPMYEGETVLLGRKGTIDRPIYHNGPFWAVDTMYWSKVKPTTNGKFVFYLATTIPFSMYATNTALPSMTKSALESHAVAFPHKEEQDAIVKIIDRETTRIDTLITKKQRFIELLKERRQAVITQAVTKGLDPTVPMRDSNVEWLGKVPSHWESTRISNLFREASRPGKDDLPVLTISIHTGITDAELSDEDRDRKVSLIEDRTKYQMVRPGDLAYNIMRAWQGGFGFVKVEGLVSPAYVVAEPKVNMVGEYFEMVMRTPMAVTEMWRFSRGIADFRMRLYWDAFKNIVVPVPPYEEQRRIVEETERESTRINSLINKTQRSIDLLKERRAAFITAAVTGKIDLRSEVMSKHDMEVA